MPRPAGASFPNLYKVITKGIQMEMLPILLLVMILPSVLGFALLAEMIMVRENQELNKLNGWE